MSLHLDVCGANPSGPHAGADLAGDRPCHPARLPRSRVPGVSRKPPPPPLGLRSWLLSRIVHVQMERVHAARCQFLKAPVSP